MEMRGRSGSAGAVGGVLAGAVPFLAAIRPLSPLPPVIAFPVASGVVSGAGLPSRAALRLAPSGRPGARDLALPGGFAGLAPAARVEPVADAAPLASRIVPTGPLPREIDLAGRALAGRLSAGRPLEVPPARLDDVARRIGVAFPAPGAGAAGLAPRGVPPAAAAVRLPMVDRAFPDPVLLPGRVAAVALEATRPLAPAGFAAGLVFFPEAPRGGFPRDLDVPLEVFVLEPDTDFAKLRTPRAGLAWTGYPRVRPEGTRAANRCRGPYPAAWMLNWRARLPAAST